MHSVDVLFGQYRKTNKGERFGQWFVNRYVKDEGNDPDLKTLFYAPSHEAYVSLKHWLTRNDYAWTLPIPYRNLDTLEI